MPDQVDWRATQGEGTPARAVGRLLRDQREELGLSLSDVGQRLRIRRPYIEAIEEGRFDELPGAAYIPAFLRAYAVHLGLDPEKVLTAYHSSGATPIARPTALPADFPLVERRKPYGLAVLTVLLVIAAGYAVWHFMPREEAVVAQKVPPVPDRLLAERAPSAPAPRVATPPQSQTQSQTPPAEMWPLPRTDNTTTIAPPPAAASPTQTTPTSTVGQAQAAQPVATPERVEVPRVEPEQRVETPPRVEAPPPQVQPQPQVQPTQRVETAPLPRIDVLRAPAEPQEARTVAPREETPRNEVTPPVARDTPIGVRVDSWVELRAANGDVLAQTYVRAGESYTIPAGIAFRVISAR